MSQHSVAETKNSLSELIDRAEKGEEIIVTRHGKPVAKITGLKPAPKPITQEAIDWLDKHRVKGKMPKEDAGTFVSRMRDEDWPR
ncbi:MAG TPA: type II toxin-antitoxin system prevent-host-death family antitoxin [Rhizomicrobium sp.]|nr:type II toxin-antitoxin system prevent-host-death family antitoxin [Rhizomicrobium sp.]